MLKSKATEIFSKLPSHEMKEVRALINSPLYNKNKNIIKLYDALKPFYPEFSDAKCTKQTIYKVIFDDKPYNDKIMRNLLSEFYKLAEEYLVYKASQSEKYKEMLLFENLIEYDTVYPKKYNEAVEKNKTRLIDSEYFFRKIYLNRSRILYYLARDKQHKIVMDALHRGEYHIFNLLQNLPENISNILANETFNPDYKIKLSENFFKSLDYTSFINSLDKNNPDYELILLNYHRFMMFYTDYPENLQHSRIVKDYLLRNHKQLNSEFKEELYNGLHNFYDRRTYRQNENVIKIERFQVCKIQIETEVFSDTNPLELNSFRSVLWGALNANELNWAEYFINEYTKYINPKTREKMYKYGQLFLCLRKKDYDKLLKICKDYPQDDSYSKFMVKWALFHAYYDLGYTEQFYSLADTFRKFFDKHSSFQPERIKKYRKVINFGVRLMNLKNISGEKDKDLSILRKEIETEFQTSLYSRDWLLEKIDELEKQNK
jgi:hypothetical protein